MANLSTVIQESLTESGEAERARAFRRVLGRALEIELDVHTVREAKSDFSGILGQVRNQKAMSIAPHRRMKDAVVMISLEQLARMLGTVATNFEQSSAADTHNPMRMFTKVDLLPEVGPADALIDQAPRRHISTLNLD